MSAIKPVFRELREAALNGGVHAKDKLHQLTERLDGHFDTVIRRTTNNDHYDGPSGTDAPVQGPQVPNPDGTGPVIFDVVDGATPEEIAQFHDYVNRSNRYLADGSLSDSGRVSTAEQIARDARREARLERIRARDAGTPYQGVVAHVPDSTWVGQGKPPGWGDYSSRVNSSLAGQVNRYPVGYDPTIFIVRE
ncbi:hypothetical protein [Marisediminicola sp. LYQ134]|uniref:hypothetical protein n=1 Tax=Marisediminicola sp. LYQ134 TaxID=3391061 RepID=UPI0039834D3C